MDRTRKLDDVSDQLCQQPMMKKERQLPHPGILLNEQMAAGAKKIKKAKPAFRMSDDEQPEYEEGIRWRRKRRSPGSSYADIR